MASQASTRTRGQVNGANDAASDEDGGMDFRDGDLDTIARTIREGRVNNPFRRWNPKLVPTVCRAFARICNLEDKTALFETCGEILRQPRSWRVNVGQQLSKDDCEALEHEKDGFWAQPKMLKVTIVLLCLGAVVQGWTQTVSNVANLGWPEQLGLPSLAADNCTGADQSETWKFGLVNASTYLAASTIGCWLSDPLSELFWGRRPPVMVSSIFILAATIGSACVPGVVPGPDEAPQASGQWKLLLACRILMGIGMGCKATVITVYAAEVSPSHLRGTLVVNWQLFVALGIFLGFASNVGISQVGPKAWRLQTATLCIPTTLVLVLVWICPDSPRYQMKRSSQIQHNRLEDIWVGIKTWFVFMRWAMEWLLKICVCNFPKEGDTPPVAATTRTSNIGPVAPENNDHSGEGAAHNEGQRPGEQSMGNPSAEDSGDHDYRKAFHTLVELRGSQILAAKELLYVHVQMVVETQVTIPERLYRVHDMAAAGADGRSQMDIWLKTPKLDKVRYVEKIRHLWKIDRVRRATGNAVVCMLSQQLSGVNVLAFYSSTLFSSTINCGSCGGNEGSTLGSRNNLLPLWLSCGIGAVNFVFGIPAYWLIESVGRRSLLLVTSPVLTVFTLGACLSYLMDPCQQSQAEGVGAFTFLFMVAYSFGMGPVPFTMSSEVFPLEHRMVGMSLAVFCNLFGAGILALVVPPISQTGLGNRGLLAIFVGLNVLSFFLILFFVRETAGTADEDSDEGTRAMTLEELTYTFSKPTKEFIAYQWNELRPYALDIMLWPFRWMWSLITRGETPPWPKKPKMRPTTRDIEMEGITAATGSHANASNGNAR